MTNIEDLAESLYSYDLVFNDFNYPFGSWVPWAEVCPTVKETYRIRAINNVKSSEG